MAIHDTLVANMRRLMKERDLDSQPRLHKASGVSQTQIGNILRGEKSPTLETLEKLAKGLGVAPYVLLISHDDRALSLLADLARCDDAGQAVVCAVAQAQAAASRR